MVQQLFSLIDFLFSFQGRVGRLAYWAYSIGAWAVILTLASALGLFDTTQETMASSVSAADDTMLVLILFGLVFAGFLWSSYAVQAKRWHDRDKSGWWSLIGFVPYIGGLWILVECGFLRGTDGPNRFGDYTGARPADLVEVFD